MMFMMPFFTKLKCTGIPYVSIIILLDILKVYFKV